MQVERTLCTGRIKLDRWWYDSASMLRPHLKLHHIELFGCHGAQIHAPPITKVYHMYIFSDTGSLDERNMSSGSWNFLTDNVAHIFVWDYLNPVVYQKLMSYLYAKPVYSKLGFQSPLFQFAYFTISHFRWICFSESLCRCPDISQSAVHMSLRFTYYALRITDAVWTALKPSDVDTVLTLLKILM